MEGVISLQLSPKSAGLIESIVNSSKVMLFSIIFSHIDSKFIKALEGYVNALGDKWAECTLRHIEEIDTES